MTVARVFEDNELEAISKIHLTPNYCVADLLKMLTEESELKLKVN
jgi:hypothetical protein